jgi:hypothetical protein
VLGKVLGQGGFGITYLANDYKRNKPVAVKEYFPKEAAKRNGPNQVIPVSHSKSEAFQYGMDRFLDEARTLAEFIGNKNIVKVHRFFKENGTAYFVMDYVKGTWSNDSGIEALGWLAVALVIFTSWKPKNATWGAYLFGFCYWIYLYIPAGINSMLMKLFKVTRTTYMQNLYKMIPYIVTIIVLVLVSSRNKRDNQAPQSLGTSYFREER